MKKEAWKSYRITRAMQTSHAREEGSWLSFPPFRRMSSFSFFAKKCRHFGKPICPRKVAKDRHMQIYPAEEQGSGWMYRLGKKVLLHCACVNFLSKPDLPYRHDTSNYFFVRLKYLFSRHLQAVLCRVLSLIPSPLAVD